MLQYVHMIIYIKVVHSNKYITLIYKALIAYTIYIKFGVLVCAYTVLLI